MTTAQTHTPGPWEISRDAVPDWHTQISVYAEGDGERVATVFRTEANARLIAAAPRMFDALSAIAAMREGNAKEIAALAASVAAITLAEIANGA